MSDQQRPDPKRRPVASRPSRAGGKGRSHSRRPALLRRASNGSSPQPAPLLQPIRRSIAAAAERRSELRVGFTARRAVILAVMVCVLTLTIAGPVRTFFAQRTEMKQQAEIEAMLRRQIADLEQQKTSLADPAHIKAQARQRLGFVMPGEIPYQVQLPATPDTAEPSGTQSPLTPSSDPWYTALWHTIADAPHGLVPAVPVVPGG